MRLFENQFERKSNKKFNINNIVNRSSAIFPFIITRQIKPKIFFLGYWLIKRNIKDIKIFYTLRDNLGKKITTSFIVVNQVKAYEINITKLLKFNLKKDFIGSIELEIFSKNNLVFPYPAIVINFDCKNVSSFVHTCGRVYNDRKDKLANNKYSVSETGFDIIKNKNYEPFFSFVNGPKLLKKPTIQVSLINSNGERKIKKIIFDKLRPYETKFVFFLKSHDKHFFGDRNGTVKIKHCFKDFFPRFLAGNIDLSKSNSTLTHTYYDLSGKLNYKKQLTKNPDINKFYNSSTAVPLMNEKNIDTELVVYPNFSNVELNFHFILYNDKGYICGVCKNILEVKKDFNTPQYLNLNNIIRENRIKLKKKKNYFCKIFTTSKKNQILNRLKLGLNLGIVGHKEKLPSNICFNMNFPVSNEQLKKGTFKWGLLNNKNNSYIMISNISYLKRNYKEANIILKFWRCSDNKFLQRKIKIPHNGNFFFQLNKNISIKKFLNKKSGWITINSDSPFVNGWYCDISKTGNVGADHLF